MMVLINVDVPDVKRATTFYVQAFGLEIRRSFGEEGIELSGWPVSLFLLKRDVDTIGAGSDRRKYGRHWTPVHLDIVVDDIDLAIARSVAAGAVVEHDVRTSIWGKIAVLADPFGHGLCLVQFLNRGYDEVADA